MARAQRNAFIERWAGREWTLRQNYHQVGKEGLAARKAGDVNHAPLLFGQDAGLIDSVLPAGEVIDRMVRDAEEIITDRLSKVIL